MSEILLSDMKNTNHSPRVATALAAVAGGKLLPSPFSQPPRPLSREVIHATHCTTVDEHEGRASCGANPLRVSRVIACAHPLQPTHSGPFSEESFMQQVASPPMNITTTIYGRPAGARLAAPSAVPLRPMSTTAEPSRLRIFRGGRSINNA